MTPAKPTIDECIADSEADVMLFAQIPEAEKQLAIATANLDFLRAHKRITEAAGRPAPVAWYRLEILGGGSVRVYYEIKAWPDLTPLYGPDLLDYADRMAAERDAERDRGDQWEITATNLLNRAETAERQLTELQAEHDTLVKDAERYRWLLHDHDAAETRERRRSICENLSVKSYSSVSRDIDAAMSAVALDEEGE